MARTPTITRERNLGVVATSGGAGEANTASNIGTGAGQVFKTKTGVDLVMRSLIAGSGVSLGNNASDITVSAASQAGKAGAWVTFNGASGAIAGSDNVTSVTNLATGSYSIAITTALSSANYAVTSGARRNTASGVMVAGTGTTKTTTTCYITSALSNTAQNSEEVSVALFDT